MYLNGGERCEDINVYRIKEVSFQRRHGAASVGALQDNLVLSTGLIMQIGHRKKIRKLSFRALVLRRREYNVSLLSTRLQGLTLETSLLESPYGGQFTLSTQLIKPNDYRSCKHSLS